MKKLLLLGLVYALVLPQSAQAEGLLKYTPPKTSAPLTLSGGGTRGFESKPLIKLLAPRHTALTSQAQPVLYWYTALPEKQAFLLSISKEGSEQPIWQQRVDNIPAEGLHSLRLADIGVTLSQGETYRWNVAIDDKAQKDGEAINNESFILFSYQTPEAPLATVE